MRRTQAALVATAALLASCSDHYHRSFDAEGWKRANPLITRTRSEMLGDLLDNHSLMGMTRDQVVTRLGEPPPTDKYRDWSLVYTTGPDGWDSEWLLLRLDRHGRISEQVVTSD